MNERDMALGRLLLQRRLCSGEALQQAAATTQSRRARGEQVELIKVLVDLGTVGPDVARGLWAEVASIPTGAPTPVPPAAAPPPRPAGGPASGGFTRPAPAPAGGPASGGYKRPAPAPLPHAPLPDGEFSPVATLSTMGEAPPELPPGYSPLGRARPAPAPPGADIDIDGIDLVSPPAPSPAPSASGLLDFTATGPTSGFGGSWAGGGAPSGIRAVPRAAALPPPSAFAPPALAPPVSAPNLGQPPLTVDSGELQLGAAAFADSGRGPAPPVQMDPGAITTVPSTKGEAEPAKKGKSGRLGPSAAAKSRRTRAGTASTDQRKGAGGPSPLVIGLVCGAVALVAIAMAIAFGGGSKPPPRDATPPAGPSTTTPGSPTATTTSPTPTTTAPTPTTPPRPPRPDRAGRDQEGFLIPPSKAPEGRHELDELSEDHALEYLVRAGDLADSQHDYPAAVAMLQRFPQALRGGSGFTHIQEKLAAYTRFEGFERELKEALAGGKDSPKLRQMVARVEGGRLQADLRALPCVNTFEEGARRVLGDALYNEIGVPSMDLDVEKGNNSSD